MPDKDGGGNPSGNANTQTQTPTPNPNTPILQVAPQQGVPGTTQTANSAQDAPETPIRRELHWLEKLNFGGQFALVIVGVIAVFIYRGQLATMNSQLSEMKHTNDLTQQALKGNDDTLTKTLAKMQGQIDETDKLYREAQKQTASGQKQAAASRQFANDNREISYRELRPYVSAGAMAVVGEVDNGKKFSGTVTIRNSGRTPAVDMEVCGDILISQTPITDDTVCPSPISPKDRVPETEISVTELGPGSDATVSSPGTIVNIEPKGLLGLLADHTFRLYFYGQVRYRDIVRPQIVHHTLFCGVYGVASKRWNACEHHNSVD